MTFINPGMKLLRHPDRLADIYAGKTPAPISIEVDLSNRCSLGCEWCHFSFTHSAGPLANKVPQPANKIPGGDLMDDALIRRALVEFKEAGVLSVTWTGGGEPTLHPSFDDIIAYTHDLGLEQGIYTHGGHINQRRAELLKRYLTFVYISLDASNAADYKRDKRVDRFNAVLDGVQRLVAAPGDATIGIGFLLTETNWQNYNEMMKLARAHGADYCQFRPTIHYTHENPGASPEDTSWMQDALQYLEPLQDLPGVEVDTSRFKRYMDWDGHGYKTCHWSTLQSVVTPNGMMWTCVNKREYAGEMIGDLSVESFADIWARHSAPLVNERCRLCCRGDVANQALAELVAPIPHTAFP